MNFASNVNGLVSYAVALRRPEIGLRLALGARHGEVEARFVREGVRLALGGLLIGVAAALASTRLMGAVLYRVPASDGVSLLLAAGVLGSVAVLASWLPARQAVRMSPATILRSLSHV